MADGAWHHVVFTYDGKTLRCCIDYREIYASDVTADIRGHSAYPVTPGCFSDSVSTCFPFYGRIDDPRIYDDVIDVPGE